MSDRVGIRGPRGPYAKSARRRDEIIEAAMQVFAQSGFRDGTLRDIAERVGMTHAGMRHHFPTKDALLEAVLRRRDEDALELAADARPHGIGVLREWIEATRRNVQRPGLIDLEVTLSAEAIATTHPAHSYFIDLYHRADDLLCRAFREIAADGELSPGVTAGQAARVVLATTLGLQQLWIWDRSRDLVGELEFAVSSLITVPLRPE
ncbi:TetR/AcrR family transcriptional regulator [Nocardia niwae]|uniref:TetR/AcrR family transcriptional regulator n=1 Tax=Nocardia niwae TaxID=626084 RepID=A0ABV2X707_9NOCA|nr:TetR/AcrR family transcriptional regulator [Nocardia niwae]